MNIKFKKALAAGSLTLALGGLALSFTGVGAAIAATTAPSGSDVGTATSSTTASTTTLPWCGWYLTGIDSALTLSGATVYDGTEVSLTAADTSLEAFVNGSSTYSAADDNCSWYGNTNKQAAWVSVTADTAAFDASTTADTAGTDNSMDFALDTDNKLNITAVEDPSANCTTNGFSITADASVFGTTLSSNPVKSALSTDVTTHDKCTWSMNYATKIPGGKVPTYGDATYTFTGPTLTTTLDIQ